MHSEVSESAPGLDEEFSARDGIRVSRFVGRTVVVVVVNGGKEKSFPTCQEVILTF